MLVEMTGAADFLKIMDFGTAQLLTSELSHPGQRATDVGTPWYMSPEQAAGQRTDQRTDLYAVGVMLFELLTGERPFVADDPMRVLEMHLRSPIPSARALKPELGISPELEAAIVKALQKQPDQRFATAEEFDQALEVVPDRPPTRSVRAREPLEPDVSSPDASSPALLPAPVPSSLLRPREKRKRRQAIAALVVVGVLLICAVAVVLLATGRWPTSP
jgi:serine/threonine-protein kinase